MRLIFLVTLVLAVSACPSPDRAESPDDPPTERERYEAVGRSNLPGAQGVQGALDATDDIQARDAQRDSVLERR